MMDVVISSGWRSTSSAEVTHLERGGTRTVSPIQGDRFLTRHGRFEVSITRVVNGWTVEYTTSGRLFGPREVIYSATHAEPRYAAWDVMCRVIRATDDEETGIMAGRSAAAWLQEHLTIC